MSKRSKYGFTRPEPKEDYWAIQEKGKREEEEQQRERMQQFEQVVDEAYQRYGAKIADIVEDYHRVHEGRTDELRVRKFKRDGFPEMQFGGYAALTAVYYTLKAVVNVHQDHGELADVLEQHLSIDVVLDTPEEDNSAEKSWY